MSKETARAIIKDCIAGIRITTDPGQIEARLKLIRAARRLSRSDIFSM